MADRKTALGDIIGTTKERLEEQSPMADALKALVDSTPVGKPTAPKDAQPASTSSHHLTN